VVLPTAAQRVRSCLAAATSYDVVWDGGAQPVHLSPWVTEEGDLVVHDVLGTPLGDRLAAEGTDLLVCVTVTDVAPLAVRDRIRGRAALSGRLTLVTDAGGEPAARLVPQSVRWQAGARPGRAARPGVDVAVPDYRAAAADPLAADEADLLLELASTPGLVAGIAGHLPACVVVQPGRPPVPLRVDRDGVVLRVEGPDRAVDARLPFGVDATTPALAWAAVEQLLARV
jgi:hypothetical protein